MSLRVIKAGLQTSLQARSYSGHRHIGMPAAGAADCLSLALANRLVGNDLSALAIEITMDGAKFTAEQDLTVALTGAASFLTKNDMPRPLHQSIKLSVGDEICIGQARQGCRSYLALAGIIEAEKLLGGQSTYLAAGLGGFAGRALKDGDIVKMTEEHQTTPNKIQTPEQYRPQLSNDFILRAVPGPEFQDLDANTRQVIFDEPWNVGTRSSRMGTLLEGPRLKLDRGGSQIASAPVFPGTIQCPPDGQPFLLGPDAQTTGGYPRIAQVIRADRHLIGQMKPGSKTRLVRTRPERAMQIYREKITLLKPWLDNFSLF